MQQNGWNLVRFTLLPATHKVVHIGILSCCSYIESIIHFHWILQRTRETWSNQVVNMGTYLGNGMDVHYSITCKNRNTLTNLTHNFYNGNTLTSLSHNLLCSAQWESCKCITYRIFASTPTPSHYLYGASTGGVAKNFNCRCLKSLSSADHSHASTRISKPHHTVTACDRVTSQSLY